MEPGAAQRRAERGRVDRDDRPQPGSLVLTEDDLLMSSDAVAKKTVFRRENTHFALLLQSSSHFRSGPHADDRKDERVSADRQVSLSKGRSP
jgi:hypothetical protein